MRRDFLSVTQLRHTCLRAHCAFTSSSLPSHPNIYTSTSVYCFYVSGVRVSSVWNFYFVHAVRRKAVEARRLVVIPLGHKSSPQSDWHLMALAIGISCLHARL